MYVYYVFFREIDTHSFSKKKNPHHSFEKYDNKI